MATLAHVYVGVDTHRDTHTVAVVDHLGGVHATASFDASPAGYQRATSWMSSFGTIVAIGVEGTGSYGAGLARHLNGCGHQVREVIRPNRQHRRRHGKSDTADAIAAARAVISGEASGKPRGGDGPIEAIRVIKRARDSAVKQRTAVTNQIHALIVTAPEPLRSQLEALTIVAVTNRAFRMRPADPTNPTDATKHALRSLARRWRALTTEINEHDRVLAPAVTAISPPALLTEPGIGPCNAADLLITVGDNPDRITSEAAFAAICGVSPVDASSGLQQRHRLNRGGDRQANAALHRIVLVRLRYHQPTRDYMDRRLSEGKTKKEAIRCLKRHLARHLYKHLKPTH